MQYTASEDQIARIVFGTSGPFGRAGWGRVNLGTLLLAVVSPFGTM